MICLMTIQYTTFRYNYLFFMYRIRQIKATETNKVKKNPLFNETRQHDIHMFYICFKYRTRQIKTTEYKQLSNNQYPLCIVDM